MITTGCYSDYSVHSIWSTRELAEKALYFIGDRYKTIDEMDVDEFPENGFRYWAVFWFNPDGSLFKEWQQDYESSFLKEKVEPTSREGKRIYVETFGKDRDHAFKKACDMRAAFLAEKNGI